MSDEYGSPRAFISFTDSDEFDSPVLDQIASSDPAAGQVIADYKIIDKVGEGAMAIVYKAKQLSTGRIVAIKTLRYVEQDLAERFAREMSIHSSLKHRNIVEAIDCISTPHGRAYFVMEYLSGMTLEDHLGKYGRRNSPTEIAEILSQICDALDFAHRQGIIHRDVKPENIILLEQPNGEKLVKVLDFGVAKIQEDLQRLTKTGVVLGSPAYMSPEQCMGMDLDPRSDLYSLGVVAFEMVTGELPFDADTPVEMMEAHCDPEIKPVQIRSIRTDLAAIDELQAVFDHVLQTEQDDRPSTIDDFKRELNIWWQVATAGYPDRGPSPFTVSNRPAPKPQKKAETVLNTVEVRSLNNLTGRRQVEEAAKEASLPIPKNMQLPILIGTIAIVLISLTAFLASFLLSSLNQDQAQQPAPAAASTPPASP